MKALRVSALLIAASALLVVAAAARGQTPDVSKAALTGVTVETAALYASIALADARVAVMLAQSRYRIVEVADYGDGKSGPIVWIYDYSQKLPIAVEIRLSDLAVVDVRVSNSAPNVSQAEREEARDIALRDPSILDITQGSYLVVNFSGSMAPQCAGRHCVAVFLIPPDRDWEKLIVAIIDLTSQSVVGFAR